MSELKQIVKRYERLEAEKRDIADAQKEVMAEAKAGGYDTRVLRRVIALRKLRKDERDELDTLTAMYFDEVEGLGNAD